MSSRYAVMLMRPVRFFPANANVVHVGFPDPPKMAKELAENGASEDEQLDCYRQVRDKIKAYIETLPEVLTGE